MLGIVNNLWQPLPNKIKDYIAFPKPNGYQSLHTTVFAGDGGIVEVQIRTREMHSEAQFGIAAHVIYKEREGGAEATRGRGSSFDWIRSLIPGLGRKKAPATTNEGEKPGEDALYKRFSSSAPEWLDGLEENELDDVDFETAVRSDIFSHRVFVFTPKGDAIDLPAQATPIDFAYAIHSDLGNHVSGSKVNGKMVPLDTALHNGDIVEIQTKKNAQPKQKWLDFTKTTVARRHIRNALGDNQNEH